MAYNSRKLNDLTHPIERLEAFEDRVGIRFESLCVIQYACRSYPEGTFKWVEIDVNGEVHPKDDTKITQNIELVVNVYDSYDSAARLLSTSSHRIVADSFFGFEAFSIHVGDIPLEKLARVRLFPKPSSW